MTAVILCWSTYRHIADDYSLRFSVNQLLQHLPRFLREKTANQRCLSFLGFFYTFHTPPSMSDLVWFICLSKYTTISKWLRTITFVEQCVCNIIFMLNEKYNKNTGLMATARRLLYLTIHTYHHTHFSTLNFVWKTDEKLLSPEPVFTNGNHNYNNQSVGYLINTFLTQFTIK